jgi:CHAD domain-containing protein
MTTDATEIETKYDVPEGASLPPMEDLPGVTAVAHPEAVRLEAEYYDTPDLKLIRSGVTLRRRTGGSDEGWHLKLPAGPQTRREIRDPLGAPDQQPPVRLTSLVRGLVRGKQLGPVARMTTVRQPVILLGKHSEPLAEVAIDDVSAQALGDVIVARSWHEVEIELKDGNGELLRAADVMLRRNGLQPAGRSAKLERALGLDGSAQARPEPTDASSAGEVVRAYLRAQTAVLTSHDPMVRMNEPDAVHKMRITTRRLRSVLQAFRPVLGESADQLADELKWLGGLLGSARDAEVLEAHFQAGLDRLPGEQVIGPVAARIQGHFASAGADARRAAVEALDSERYFGLLDGMEQLAASPVRRGPGSKQAADVLPDAVLRTYRRTRRRMQRADKAPPGEATDVSLHEARKAAKRARYAAEAVAPAFGHDARRFARRLKSVQSILGEHQDTVVARHAVRQLAISAHLAGENAFSYGVLYEQDACDSRELRAEAFRAFEHADRSRYRRWLHGN